MSKIEETDYTILVEEMKKYTIFVKGINIDKHYKNKDLALKEIWKLEGKPNGFFYMKQKEENRMFNVKYFERGK